MSSIDYPFVCWRMLSYSPTSLLHNQVSSILIWMVNGPFLSKDNICHHSFNLYFILNNFVCYHQLDNYDCANKTWFDHIISDILAYFVNMYFHNPSFITCHTCCSHKFEIFTISPVTTQPVTHELTRASQCWVWPLTKSRYQVTHWRVGVHIYRYVHVYVHQPSVIHAMLYRT